MSAAANGQLSRHRRLIALAGLAAGILALLALFSWPRGLAGRELIREDLHQLQSTDWILTRNGPGRMQSFVALGKIVENLKEFVDTGSAKQDAILRGDLTAYATELDNLSTSRDARDEQLLAARDHGLRIASKFEEGLTNAVLVAARWRVVLFAWSALLMALLLVGTRRLLSAERALAQNAAARAEADRARAAAEEVNRLMGAFLARMSQEISAPVATLPDPPPVEKVRVTEAQPKTARVLLAEDGEDNRRLIEHLVKRVQLELCMVENGALAIEEVQKARAAGRPFDVLLMDMQMPVLDGYSAVQRLRALGVRTPIMALTANAMPSDRKRYLDGGCDEFCAKPIDFEQFFTALERCLALGRARTPAALPQPRPIARPAAKDDGLAQLVEQFVRELGDEVLALREKLAQGELPELARLAHQLKGSCGSYGFPELSRRAAELERRVKDAAGREAIEAALEEFAKSCAGVRSSTPV